MRHRADRVSISGTNLGTLRIPLILNDLKRLRDFHGIVGDAFLLFTLDYGMLGG
jgi:hypothetical protein